MTIDPALNIQMRRAALALSNAGMLTQQTTKDAIVGAMMQANEYVGLHAKGQVEHELEHIVASGSILQGLYTVRGFAQDAIIAPHWKEIPPELKEFEKLMDKRDKEEKERREALKRPAKPVQMPAPTPAPSRPIAKAKVVLAPSPAPNTKPSHR